MAKSIVGDWDYSPEDLKRLDRAAKEFAEENLEHPHAKLLRQNRPDLFQSKKGSSPVPPFLKPRKGKP